MSTARVNAPVRNASTSNSWLMRNRELWKVRNVKRVCILCVLTASKICGTFSTIGFKALYGGFLKWGDPNIDPIISLLLGPPKRYPTLGTPFYSLGFLLGPSSKNSG